MADAGDYRILHEADLRDYLAGSASTHNSAARRPPGRSAEVGDGNLNLVFIVKGAAGGVAVKQALPYVRLVGESWPLPLSRAHYEYRRCRSRPGSRPASCRPCFITTRRWR